MFSQFSLKTYSFRYTLSVGLAVLISVLVNHYYTYSNEFWIILSAFLVSQTTRGTPLRQGLNVFLSILIALFLTSFLLMHIHEMLIIYFVAVIFIAIGMILFLRGSLLAPAFYPLFCFLLVILFSALEPIRTTFFLHDRILDAIIGVAIGLLSTRLILFVRFDKEFRQGLVPLLDALIPYSKALMHSFLHPDANQKELFEKKMQVEQNLQSQGGQYPEWVYELGFNPGLRSGFRFFLITIERIVELFFSMNYLISRHAESLTSPQPDVKALADAITTAMKKNQELLLILANYLARNVIEKTHSDFTSDIVELENALRRIVPNKLELLDISPDNITLTAFVRDIKDMRGLLLQLVMALPAADAVMRS